MKNPMLFSSLDRVIDPNSMLGKLKADTIRKHAPMGDYGIIPIYFADFMNGYEIPNTEFVINILCSSNQERERPDFIILYSALHQLSRESIVISQDFIIDHTSMIEDLDTDRLLIFKFDFNLKPTPGFGEDYHFFKFMESWFNDLIITFINASGDDDIFDYWPSYYSLFQQTLFSAGHEELEQQCMKFLTHIRPDFFDNII